MMAISKTHYELLKLLKSRRELPQGGSILEIGEANVYGDWDFDADESILKVKPFPIGSAYELGTGKVIPPKPAKLDQFEQAMVLYHSLFDGLSEVVSIDADPSRKALKIDLNHPHKLDQQFDVAINHGTAEHIFDIGNVLRTMHDNVRVGGLMIHECPFTGWLDHGFYCLQPTLFWDVARVNNYQMVLLATEHLASRTYQEWSDREGILEAKRRGQLADNLMLFVAMRKTVDAPFVVPIQGVYAGAVSETVQQRWGDLR